MNDTAAPAPGGAVDGLLSGLFELRAGWLLEGGRMTWRRAGGPQPTR
jgi:hypothetical protein